MIDRKPENRNSRLLTVIIMSSFRTRSRDHLGVGPCPDALTPRGRSTARTYHLLYVPRLLPGAAFDVSEYGRAERRIVRTRRRQVHRFVPARPAKVLEGYKLL